MYNDQNLKKRRQELRANDTRAENILWAELRDRQLNNMKFYRQYSVGPYILDFYCPKVRVAIELDGEQHKDAVEYDKEREFFLKSKNIHTLRFWNNEIINNLSKILNGIKDVICWVFPLSYFIREGAGGELS